MPRFTEGYCYLEVVRAEHRDVVVDIVGFNPPVGVFLNGVEDFQLDGDKLLECGWYEGYDVQAGRSVYHIGRTGHGKRLASVASVMVAALGARAPLTRDVIDSAEVCDVVLSSDCCIGQDVGMEAVVPVSEELVQLTQADFTACFCKVHSVPLTHDKFFSVEGCCKRPAGKAGVIAAAFDGKSKMCHAEPGVRAADARFLGAVVSGKDPGILDGKARPAWFAALCTSSDFTDRGAFGNGYCYLDAVERDALWRCARLLGPNPLVSSVANVLLWAGKVCAKKFVMKKVKEGYYHLLHDKSSKGVDSRAGRKLMRDLAVIVACEPEARVGGPSPSAEVEELRQAGAVSEAGVSDYGAVTDSDLSVTASLVVPRFALGLEYLAMVPLSRRSEVVTKLGRWPTFDKLFTALSQMGCELQGRYVFEFSGHEYWALLPDYAVPAALGDEMPMLARIEAMRRVFPNSRLGSREHQG